MTPRYRCKCTATFDVPFPEEIKVKMFAADYERTWRPVDAQIKAKALDDLYLNGSTQQSMRPVDLEQTRSILDVGIGGGDPWWSDDGGVRPIPGGHKLTLQKQRYGQSSFRQSLLRRFGKRCAISGPQPEATLEAAHLYKYADTSVHDLTGGLLLRRDLHTLFDRWSIAVDTATWSIRVSPELLAYPSLASLDGQPLSVPESLRPKSEYLDVHYGLAREAWATSP